MMINRKSKPVVSVYRCELTFTYLLLTIKIPAHNDKTNARGITKSFDLAL